MSNLKKIMKVFGICCLILIFVFSFENYILADPNEDSSTENTNPEVNYEALHGFGWTHDNTFRGSEGGVTSSELFSTDSRTDGVTSGFKPGMTVDCGQVREGWTGKPYINGSEKPVSELTAFYQKVKRVSSQEAVDYWTNIMGSREAAQEYVSSQMEAHDGNYNCEYFAIPYGEPIEVKYIFTDDGKRYMVLPEGMDENAIYAEIGIIDPETGKPMYTTNKYNWEYLQLGTGIDPDAPEFQEIMKQLENFDPNNPNTVNEDDGHCFVYSNVSDPIPYSDMDPKASASISNPIYDVTTAIPTSENVTYNISAKQALYDIGVRKITLQAGVRNIKIVVKASWKRTETHRGSIKTDKNGNYIKDKNGNYVYNTSTTTKKGTETRIIDSAFTYEPAPRIYYDVPKSSIFPVQTGTVSATQGSNTLTSGPLSLTGTGTPGPQTLGWWAVKPGVSDTYTIDLGNKGSYPDDAKKAVNNYDGEIAKDEIRDIVDGSIGVTGSVNYYYEGLSVTTTNLSGSPNVDMASNSTTNMIPETYPNGTYNGSASVTYSNGPQSVGCNNVIVHTPVVNNANISYVSNFVNQKINVDASRKYLILDGSFTITIPNNGTHNDYKGYGKRDYNSNQAVPKKATNWGATEDVKLPFDAYLHVGNNEKFFVPKNTWLSDITDLPISLTRRIIYLYNSSMGRRKVL